MRLIYTLLLVVSFSWLQGQVLSPIDAKSKVSFKIKNFGSPVDGTFKGLKGKITFDINSPTAAAFDVSVEAATINTGISMRDNHLRKSDYFDVTEFPILRFVSSKVEKSDKPNEGIVKGKLTIKKKTKEISFPFRFKEIDGALQFTATFNINRRYFDVGGNSFSLSDELIVVLDIIAAK